MWQSVVRLVHYPALALVLVWLMAVVVFAAIQSPRTLLDPDSFYHARLATTLRDSIVLKQFPWTTASLYQTTFYDHHLGYHLLLVPFVSLPQNELAGLKLATVLFASFSIVALAWVLRRWQVPWWGAWSLVLLTLSPFLFRLSLAKAPSLAIGVAVVGYYLITARRVQAVFWFSWFNTLFYSSWPLLPVFALFTVAIEAFTSQFQGWRELVQRIVSRRNWLLAGAIIGGIVCGLMFNPYFPQNLTYLKQLFSMALVPYHTFLGIGGEWYPFSPFDLPEYLAYGLLLWVLATVVGVASFRKQSALSRTTWLTALFFLFYTLRARRQAEYLSPWLVLSAGLLVRDSAWGKWQALVALWRELVGWLPDFLKRRSLAIVLVGYLVVLVPLGLWRGLQTAHDSLVPGFTSSRLTGVSQWLAEHGEAKAVVFQVDWSTFPLLWYHNPRSYYLTGLDQTFMYEAGHDRYWEWLAIVRGERRQAYDLIQKDFGARYVLIEKRTPALLMWVNRDPRFTRVYEDLDILLYQL